MEYFKLYDGEDGSITRKTLVQAYDAENVSASLFLDWRNIEELLGVISVVFHNDNRPHEGYHSRRENALSKRVSFFAKGVTVSKPLHSEAIKSLSGCSSH